MFAILSGYEIEIVKMLYSLSNVAFDYVALFFHYMAHLGFIYILIGLILVINKKTRKIGLIVLLVMFLTAVGTSVLKELF